MNTLNQVAGAAGTAIAISIFTAGQTGYLLDFPDASQREVLAAGVKRSISGRSQNCVLLYDRDFHACCNL